MEQAVMQNPVTETTMDEQLPEVEVVVYNALTASERKKFETQPILQKKSNVNGWVELFAPNAPASEWGKLPWLLKAEKDSSGRPYAEHESSSMKIEVASAHAHEAYERPYFAERNLHWHFIGETPDTPELAGVGAAPEDGESFSRFRA